MTRLLDAYPDALFHALDSDGDEVIVTTADDVADGALYIATSDVGANLHREDVDALIEALAPYASDAEDAEEDNFQADAGNLYPEPPLLDPRRVAALEKAKELAPALPGPLFSVAKDPTVVLEFADWLLDEEENLVDAFSFDPEPQA